MEIGLARQQRETARRAAEPAVRAALELMPQLVWTTTPDGYHDYYNERWYAYTGMPRPGDPAAGDEGWNWKAYLHPDDYERTVARWQHSLATGEPYEIEYRFKEAATGRYRWFLGRALPLREPGPVGAPRGGDPGPIVRWFGTCTDIDDQRAAAERLGVLATGLVAEAEAAARAAARAAQLQALAAALAAARTPAAVAAALLTHGTRALGAVHGTVGLVEHGPGAGSGTGPTAEGAAKDGTSEGRAPVLVIVAADGLPEATRQAFDHLVLDAATRMALPFTEAAATGHAVYVPDSAALAARYPAVAEVAARMGVGAVAALPLVVGAAPADTPADTPADSPDGAGGARILGAVVFDYPAPRAFPDDERAQLAAVAGQAAIALARAQAAADAEAARRTAEAERERATEANAAKSQFLANMSHELRTPLNAIQGHVQLLEMGLHGPVTNAQRDALARVGRAQQHLLGLINDVLNYAKLEAGKVVFDVRDVLVADVAGDVVPLIEPQLAAKGLMLRVSLPEDPDRSEGPIYVRADREKLGQVLLNLLSNAVKFTPATQADGAPGRVLVELVGRARTPDVVYLRVRDTGVGVPRDRQGAIFDPFVQVRTGYTATAQGTGLGLAISRDLARGMGGDLRVRSREGAGATFTVTLRRAGGSGPAGAG